MQRNASLPFRFWAATALVAVTASASPALAAPRGPQPSRPPVDAVGTLVQLGGTAGCVADRSAGRRSCAPVRALRGPGPFLGSNAIAVSPDGRNVYVAASDSDAIAVFARDARSGRLTQRSGSAGCIAARGASGCAAARGLDGPNSLAITADGAHVYATSLESDAVTVLRRDGSTGALRQLPGAAGCIGGGVPVPGCAAGRGIAGPDVVTVSPDGENVYVGSFAGNALAVFARDASSGRLTQPADASGCLVAVPTDGCTTVLALLAPEGMAISGDGDDVYVAAALGNALLVLTRDAASGALTQATDGSGCIVESALAGCTTGVQLAGANAVAVSPDGGDVYVTSLTSNSLTSFTRASGSGTLTQQSGTSACAIYVLAVGCSLARALSEPEGLAVAPDGETVYAAAFGSGALGVFDRAAGSGALMQKPRRAGCLTSAATPDCRPARALRGASSIAPSPDGRFLYATAFRSDAVAVFERVIKTTSRARGTR
jgi:DNA-binding beta-propeller fold protein YncE